MKSKKLLIGIFVATFFSIPLLWSQTHEEKEQKEIFDMKMKIINMKKQLQYFKKQEKILSKEIAEFSTRHKVRLEQVHKRLAAARVKLREEKNKGAAISFRVQGLRNKKIFLQRVIANFKQSNAVHLNSVSEAIKKGLPFNLQSRLAQITTLKTESKLPRVSGLEIFNRLFHFLKNEMLFSTDAQAYASTDSNTDEQFLRIGQAILLSLSSKEGARMMVANKNQRWVSINSSSKRLALDAAFKIIQGKKAPDFAIIPVDTTMIRFEEKTR